MRSFLFRRGIEDTMKQFYIRPEDVSFYEEYVDKIIGITGSYGKTSTKNILHDILNYYHFHKVS